VRAYRRATELEPGNATFWSSLGEAVVMASEHDTMPKEAAAAFDKAIRLDPRSRAPAISWRCARIWPRIMRGRPNPANVDGWIMLMRSRMTLGETAKASAAYKDAKAANPAQAARIGDDAQVLGVPGA
jgi:cytochrome c-type biogenesis protein CcmH/NrfG